MSIYDTLNPMQKEAVFFDKGPLLILAGAGSGKTRVLTHRIAYLIEEMGVSPFQILAITFTNKAAKEMRERVDNIVSYGAENIWVSTFHSTCVRILRRFIESLGYSRNFTIYDTDDQKTLVRDICKSLNIDTKQVKERAFLSAISSAKDELISPEEYAMKASMDFSKKNFSRVYTEYQKRLKASNALDFDDLIFKTVELFQTNPEVLEYYRRRFRYGAVPAAAAVVGTDQCGRVRPPGRKLCGNRRKAHNLQFRPGLFRKSASRAPSGRRTGYAQQRLRKPEATGGAEMS